MQGISAGYVSAFKATYYNPIKRKNTEITTKDSYEVIPMALRAFGKCFKLVAKHHILYMIISLYPER